MQTLYCECEWLEHKLFMASPPYYFYLVERFGLNVSGGNKSKLTSTEARRSNAAETTEPLEQSLAGIREIKVKQRPPASLEMLAPVSK